MPDFTGQHPEGPDPSSLDFRDAISQGRQPLSTTSSQLSSLKIRLQKALKQYPDFPSPGVLFEDILPIFRDPALHHTLIHALELHILENYGPDQKPDLIVGLEARGFLFGPSLALRLGAGFTPVRKKGKLPGPVESAAFEKEYGSDQFSIQSDAIQPGQRVIIVDDIIATGGSAAAAGQLVQKLGGQLLGFVMLLELDFLHGRDKLPSPCHTLLSTQSASTSEPP